MLQDFRSRPIVLFGAGGLGRRILHGLRSTGVEPCAFADNNPDLRGQRVDKIEVLAPAEAAKRFGSTALFVIAVWRPAQSGGVRDINHQLRALGCEFVVPFSHVLWSLPDLLPHYLWDVPAKMEPQQQAIEEALSLFKDQASRVEFDAQVGLRQTSNFDAMPKIETHPQYFPPFLTLNENECFVDCGAYDGDSIDSFLAWSGGRFRKIIAFEADPSCFEKLRDFAAVRTESSDRLACHQMAVGATAGTVRFDATGTAGASVSKNGGIEVQCVALDQVLQTERPTFIKMDIEGAELDALGGARETIRRFNPVLAICVYHLQNHLWRVPLLMRELLPDGRFFLRSYCLDGLDTVCYAIPENRLAV
jgi:FkbM family methyltransferase